MINEPSVFELLKFYCKYTTASLNLSVNTNQTTEKSAHCSCHVMIPFVVYCGNQWLTVSSLQFLKWTLPFLNLDLSTDAKVLVCLAGRIKPCHVKCILSQMRTTYWDTYLELVISKFRSGLHRSALKSIKGSCNLGAKRFTYQAALLISVHSYLIH